MPKILTRREFLGCVTTTAASWYLTHWELPEALAAAKGGFFENFGPIDRSFEDRGTASFFGDDFERPHKILWDSKYLASKKAPALWEETDLVIVGGGLSGLFTAYAFRGAKPIVLEQASRFGGNAKGQSWRGIDFGLGSAYFPEPGPNSNLHRFYTETGLDRIVQTAPTQEPVSLDGKLFPGFWLGEAEPQHKAVYAKLAYFLEQMYEGKKPYPDIPTADPSTLKYLAALDGKNLLEALETEVGPLPPALKRGIEAYCWSAFAAAPTEISAAAGLCFLASESAPLCVAPGGNAGVAEHLLKTAISQGVPTSHFRTNSVVVQVKVEGDQVKVLYENAEGKLKGIVAKSAVLACPKFVVAKILDGIEPEREAAIKEIEYRSYLTAGALIQKPLQARIYDLFLPEQAGVTAPSKATDVVVGSLGQTRGRNTVLTLYRALPGADARTVMASKDSYGKIRGEFQKQIEMELIPQLGFSKKDIVDIRVARWGHALPVPKQGIFARNIPQALRKPFGTRVFFVEQDNWLTPAMETGVGDLVLQEPLIQAALGNKNLTRRK